MKLVNMPKPLVLKLIDGFSIKVWIKLVFIFDIPLILLQPPYAGHKPICWGASLQGSQHHTCMVQHMGVSMDAAAGHVRASWIMTFYSSYFWVFFFQKHPPKCSTIGSLWYCFTVENAVHEAFKKQTLFLYFSLGEGKRPKLWRAL